MRDRNFAPLRDPECPNDDIEPDEVAEETAQQLEDGYWEDYYARIDAREIDDG